MNRRIRASRCPSVLAMVFLVQQAAASASGIEPTSDIATEHWLSGNTLMAFNDGPIERSTNDYRQKVDFDIEKLDEDGLIGTGSGRRALDYEFCIPDRVPLILKVRHMDPSLVMHRGSPGRIGCGDGEVLCIGNTHQAGWRDILENLAAEPAIRKISQAFFE